MYIYTQRNAIKYIFLLFQARINIFRESTKRIKVSDLYIILTFSLHQTKCWWIERGNEISFLLVFMKMRTRKKFDRIRWSNRLKVCPVIFDEKI